MTNIDDKEVEKYTVRVNISIHKDVYQFYKRRSKETGIPMSYLMSMMLQSDYEQKLVASSLPELMKLIELKEKTKA